MGQRIDDNSHCDPPIVNIMLETHLCSSLMYCNLAGGAISFKYEHFVEVNGYPNSYVGWGGEDDDFSAR